MKKFLLKLINWERMKKPKIEITQNQEHVRESNWSKATRGMDPVRDAWIDEITQRPPRPLSGPEVGSEVKKKDQNKK